MTNRIDVLKPLIGEWETTITLLDPDGRDGAVSSAIDIYRWSANEAFVEHRVDARMDGQRLQSLEVIAADPAGGGYITHSYDADGSVSVFSAALDGRRWRIVGEAQRFDGEFSADGRKLAGRWEQKSGAGWQPLMKVSLLKR